MAAIIRIKRSGGTAAPNSLHLGELAVTTGPGTKANEGGRLFVGVDASDPTKISEIGGQFYVDTIKEATSANEDDKIVRRDLAGNFAANVITANLTGTADYALQLKAPRTIQISGDISGSETFDGSNNINIQATLPTVSTASGRYGSDTEIPQIDVNTKGQVTGVTPIQIYTHFDVEDDEGGGLRVEGGNTLKILGDDLLTTDAQGTDTIKFDLDAKVLTDDSVHTLTKKTMDLSSGTGNTFSNVPNSALEHSQINFVDDAGGSKSIELGTNLTIKGTPDQIETAVDVGSNSIQISLPDNVTVAGNLTVNGTTTTVESQNLSINDPLIELAKGNNTNSVDIGFYGTYRKDGETQDKYTGFFRDTAGEYFLVSELAAKPDTTFTGTGNGGAISENDLATLNVELDGGSWTT